MGVRYPKDAHVQGGGPGPAAAASGTSGLELAASAHAAAAIRKVARRCVPDQVVAVHEPLARVAGRLPAGAPFLFVVEEGRLVGVLTAGDLTATAALHALRSGAFPTPQAAADDVAAPGASG